MGGATSDQDFNIDINLDLDKELDGIEKEMVELPESPTKFDVEKLKLFSADKKALEDYLFEKSDSIEISKLQLQIKLEALVPTHLLSKEELEYFSEKISSLKCDPVPRYDAIMMAGGLVLHAIQIIK